MCSVYIMPLCLWTFGLNSFHPLLPPVAPRDTLFMQKPDRCRKNGKAMLKKASNLNRAVGIVQPHMHWTFIKLYNAFLHRHFIIPYYSMFVTLMPRIFYFYLGAKGTGGGKELKPLLLFNPLCSLRHCSVPAKSMHIANLWNQSIKVITSDPLKKR
jgi:hypothetical protein